MKGWRREVLKKTIVIIGNKCTLYIVHCTNVDTGWKGGAVAHLEKLLGRKLVLLVCDTN